MPAVIEFRGMVTDYPKKIRDKEHSAEQKLPVAGFERGRRERIFWVSPWKGEQWRLEAESDGALPHAKANRALP